MGDAVPATDLTITEGAPVNPEVLIERDADDKLVVVAEAGQGTLYVATQGSPAKALGAPVAALLYVIAVTIPLVLVAVGGKILGLDRYLVGAASMAAGIGAGILACHLARHPGHGGASTDSSG